MEESSLSLTLESPSDVTRTVKGEIAWEPVKEKLDEAYKELGKNISLKGFRKGKVPRGLLVKMFQSRIAGEISHNLVQEALVDAIQRLDLRPVLPIPSWEVEEGEIKEGETLPFSATFEVLPEVEAKVWEGLEITRRDPKVEDADVERYLAMKQEELTQYVPVEGRNIEAGHIVHCDVMGKVGDEPVSMEHLAFLMPEDDDPDSIRLTDPEQKAMAWELAKQLRDTSAEPGERDLKITFGDDAPEPWQGKTAQLLVEVETVRERQVPELDDDFAKDTGEADTLDEYRDKVRAQLLEAEQAQAKQDQRRQIEDKLIEANPIEVTSTLVEKQLNSVMDRARMAFQLRGVSPDALGLDDDSMRDKFRDSAEKEVKKTLLTDAVARAEKVEISDEELDARLAEIAEARGESPARVKAEYEKEGHLEGLRVVMREEKVIDLLLERAHVTTVNEPEAESSEGDKGEQTVAKSETKEEGSADDGAENSDEEPTP